MSVATYSQLLPKLEVYGLDDTSMCSNSQYKLYSKVRKTFQLESRLRIFQTEINLMELWFHKTTLSTIMADEAYTDYCIEESLVSLLHESMSVGHVIWVFFDLTDYVVTCNSQSKLDYESHGTCGIFIPDQSGNYSFYYINSHGRYMKEELLCEYKLSSTRKKTIPFSNSHNLDEWFCNQLINTLRQKRTIHFTFTERYVYMGPDLQVGDTIGICYIFPFIMFLCFAKSFDRSVLNLIKGNIQSLILNYLRFYEPSEKTFPHTTIKAEQVLQSYYDSIIVKMIQEIIAIRV